jgi:hypothetical protein
MAFNKRLKQNAIILIYQEHNKRRKAADEKNGTGNISGAKKPQRKTKGRKTYEESSGQEDDTYGSKICCEFWENYFKITSKSDWIQC